MLNVLSITSSSCCIYESELTETCNVTRCLRVRPAGVGRRSASGDQRSELHPLQDLRHQGPEPEHQLGGAGRRRRSCIQRHVNTTATDSCTFISQTSCSWLFLADQNLAVNMIQNAMFCFDGVLLVITAILLSCLQLTRYVQIHHVHFSW